MIIDSFDDITEEIICLESFYGKAALK